MMPHPQEDPIVRSSRREAVATVVIWFAALCWSVGYCYAHGYNRPLDASLEGMTFYFGWPDWVFFGIVVPWGSCVIVSTLFAFVFMQDAPLGEDRDDDGELA
ncbi:MAG: DUF997 family protein [Pirellulales bacterium]